MEKSLLQEVGKTDLKVWSPNFLDPKLENMVDLSEDSGLDCLKPI